VENLKKKTVTAFFWDLTGKLADQGVGFIVSIILARLLMPEDFGLLAMGVVVIAIAHVFTDMGLNVALIQRKELDDAHYGSVFFFNIVVGVSLTILFFALAGPVSHFYDAPKLKSIFQVLSLEFTIYSFCNVQRAWLTRQLKFGVITSSRIVGMIIGGTIGVIMAFNGWGVWALVAQSMISGICSNVYIYFFTGWKPRLIFQFKALKELWSFGFRLFISGLLNSTIGQLDTLIIGKIFSSITLGYYYRARSLNDFVIRYSSGSIMPSLFPAMSKIQADSEKYNRAAKKAFQLIAVVVFLIIGGLYVSGKDIIVILFSDKWLPSVPYFKVLLMSAFGYPLSALLVSILASKGNSKAFLRLEIYKQSFVLLNLGVGFIFGIYGYLYGLIISTIICLGMNIRFAGKESGISSGWFIWAFSKYLLIALFPILALMIMDHFIYIKSYLFHGLISGVFFLGIYILINHFFSTAGYKILMEELKQIRNKKSKNEVSEK
jgi:teichuronic acid exporter